MITRLSTKLKYASIAFILTTAAVRADTDEGKGQNASPSSETQVEQLPPLEVSGHALMGISAGIACKGILSGPVTHVIVKRVSEDGRAAKLGVLKGDEILAINDRKLVGQSKSEVYALMEQVSQARNGSFEIRRKGAEKPLRISWVLKD